MMFWNFIKRVTKNEVNSETNNDSTPDELSNRNTIIRDSPDKKEIPCGLLDSPKSSTKVINKKRARDETPELTDESIHNESQFFEELLNSIEDMEDEYLLDSDSSDLEIPCGRTKKRSKDEASELTDRRVLYKRLKNNLLGSLKDGLEDIRQQRAINDSGKKANPLSKLEDNLLEFKLGDDNKIVLNRKSPPEPKPLMPLDPPKPAKKSIMKMKKKPFKVLDAPELQDDFYLNLVDWSSTNIVSVGLGSCVHLYNTCASEVTRLCDLSESDNELYEKVTSVSWFESGEYLAVGCRSGLAQVWDVTANKCINTLKGHIDRVGALAWNGDILISGSRDGSILQRDIRTPCIVAERKLEAHQKEVCGLKWSPDKQNLASGGDDNRLCLWNMHSLEPYQTYIEHTAAVKAIAWSPHQRGLMASGGGTGDQKIRFWGTLTGKTFHTVDTGSQVCNLAWSKYTSELVSTHGHSSGPEGRHAGTFANKYANKYGDYNKGYEEGYEDGYEDGSLGDSLADSFCGYLGDNARDSPGNQILLWKYPSVNQAAKPTGNSYRALYMASSPDGDSIVTGGSDETLMFWDIFTGTRPRKASKLLTSCSELQ